jgi:hypothetical protein
MRKFGSAIAVACVSVTVFSGYAMMRRQAVAAIALPNREMDVELACVPQHRIACGVSAPWLVSQPKQQAAIQKSVDKSPEKNLFKNYASHLRATVNTGCLPGSIKAALAKVQAQCGGVTIISAHRSGARIAGSGKPSYHASCQAADFTMSNYACGMRALSGWGGGLSNDPHRVQHLHMDTGPRIRFAHGGGSSSTRYARRGGGGRSAYASSISPSAPAATTW